MPSSAFRSPREWAPNSRPLLPRPGTPPEELVEGLLDRHVDWVETYWGHTWLSSAAPRGVTRACAREPAMTRPELEAVLRDVLDRVTAR